MTTPDISIVKQNIIDFVECMDDFIAQEYDYPVSSAIEHVGTDDVYCGAIVATEFFGLKFLIQYSDDDLFISMVDDQILISYELGMVANLASMMQMSAKYLRFNSLTFIDDTIVTIDRSIL